MIRLFLALMFCVGLSAPASANQIDPFTGFAALGDSISDDGKLGALVGAPSLNGRLSNGQVWVEYIAQAFADEGKATANLALGGATAGNTNSFDPSYLAVDAVLGTNVFSLGTLGRQVAALGASGGQALGSNPLFSVLFGGNDFLQNSTMPGFSVQSVAQDIANGIRTLAQSGAQFDDFLVANLPDFSVNPLNPGTPPEKLFQRGLTQAFNAALEAQLQILESEGLNIHRFDLFSFMDGIYAQAASLGLRLDATCTDSLFSLTPSFQNCPDIASADSFLFVDAVHFNGVVHQKIGEAGLALIANRIAVVPLPASLPLLSIVLLLLSLPARRIR